MIICHLNSPRSCTIATIQDITEVGYWRKNKSTIKDDIEKLMLSCESFGFFLSLYESLCCKPETSPAFLPTSSTGTI